MRWIIFLNSSILINEWKEIKCELMKQNKKNNNNKTGNWRVCLLAMSLSLSLIGQWGAVVAGPFPDFSIYYCSESQSDVIPPTPMHLIFSLSSTFSPFICSFTLPYLPFFLGEEYIYKFPISCSITINPLNLSLIIW